MHCVYEAFGLPNKFILNRYDIRYIYMPIFFMSCPDILYSLLSGVFYKLSVILCGRGISPWQIQ
ncbi:MAG: hypothetical protein C4581_08715 [Nitrospiraceae bacterium]|nr:MAG: hypothetical protein C4581_08715 [Nitrospiraceae bacterium]